jgi:3'(2'), 5'-bisphosphate nucleotidase
MNLARELTVARAAALEAAALVRRHASAGNIKVDLKDAGEPVTEADRAASELIVAHLLAAFPGDAILSEELADDAELRRARATRSRLWMVDPIDGTRDFIRGETGYAVMIGLCVDARPVLGVVSQPPTGLTWMGVIGGLAEREDASGGHTALRVSELRQPPGIRLVSSKSHRTDDISLFRQALAIEDEINVGGVGLKVGLVAEGSRDLYLYTGGRTKKWDTCAPEAILIAAGGRLTDTAGQPLDYAAEDLRNRRGLVASNTHLHDRVIATLATLLPPTP